MCRSVCMGGWEWRSGGRGGKGRRSMRRGERQSPLFLFAGHASRADSCCGLAVRRGAGAGRPSIEGGQGPAQGPEGATGEGGGAECGSQGGREQGRGGCVQEMPQAVTCSPSHDHSPHQVAFPPQQEITQKACKELAQAKDDLQRRQRVVTQVMKPGGMCGAMRMQAVKAWECPGPQPSTLTSLFHCPPHCRL
jgi:hypothetical protein